MSKKTNVAEPEVVQAVVIAVPKTISEQMEGLKLELNALKASYDESVKFAEFEKVSKIAAEIDEKIAEYQDLSEQLCFDELRKADNPMLEAAKRLTFPTLSAKPKKEKGKPDVMEINPVSKPIDPWRLHQKTEGGIGADKQWYLGVERLNFGMTARKCIELGIDPKSINDSYAMSDEAKKLDGFKHGEFKGKGRLNLNAANDKLMADMQKVVDGMIGEGYKVDLRDTAYLQAVYSKKDTRKALSVACANHRFMRMYMLDVCHRVVTGESYSVSYKVKKA